MTGYDNKDTDVEDADHLSLEKSQHPLERWKTWVLSNLTGGKVSQYNDG